MQASRVWNLIAFKFDLFVRNLSHLEFLDLRRKQTFKASFLNLSRSMSLHLDKASIALRCVVTCLLSSVESLVPSHSRSFSS